MKLLKLNKTWVNKDNFFIYEIRERRDKNVLHYEYAVIEDGTEIMLESGFTSKEQARTRIKKKFDIKGQFKIKKAVRKRVISKKVEYDGHTFDSMTERDFYMYLQNNKLATITEMQKSFHLLDGYEIPSIVNKKGSRSVRAKIYTPDFICHLEGYGMVAFEVKGSVKSIPRDLSLRRHLFESEYGIQLVIVTPDKKEGWKFS
ncbi:MULTISPECIES: DUF1064 domain-containing protein [Bacillus]|uniref:DUF1064 domain-containing protein n=1 Tax=Bacillus TaxID=1386 RepID=UPI001F0A81F8|nr:MULTISPECIES: DUF1064 domain-containing protein [Bacillus cereus group]MEC2946001.1 DUF1064 domain-containing protein [Bacillus cereus]MEC3175727.1 DUF1064 domain-containing protein [Bacillus cereus]MED2080195.1 DUF1064 domain-containing protein [Bacillus thuringiensis]MEE2015561.1 DUF1064 domain-containing protein [Bacillus thuringiensis]